MEKVMLLRYGEIFLKGRNRPFFEKVLLNNIRKALISFEDIKVIRAQGRFFVENYSDELAVVQALTLVFGLVSISPAYKIEKDYEKIAAVSKKLMEDELMERQEETITFKVESRRADKQFPMDSMTINKDLGGILLEEFPRLKVDVHEPDIQLQVEIREYCYLYSRIIPCAGGMPVGTNGKAALLLSGGIDSPVAGWMIAKRGVALTAVHYHSFPYTSDRSKEKVIELGKILTRCCGPIRLHIVPFTRIQQELYEKCPDEQLTILMRRYMMRIAEEVALREGAAALVTGESIGQVASQTLESLAVTNDAVSMPVFRPLIGFDKVDIMNTAETIGTYETSILPYEDCCTVFTPRHPVTKPRLENILKSEQLINGEELIQEALDNIEVIQLP
ncbi:MAG TPA: tRNA 4-thiouridine(8) synthase ThiI [Clostridiales bacterium]|nr:tRNA 4-thiouridine(8) synthase ThiI [Clostridia bacterium]HCS74198.1 tRNA 4-thiouridine(8) synthase ThiI [Clostridiales bacterium]